MTTPHHYIIACIICAYAFYAFVCSIVLMLHSVPYLQGRSLVSDLHLFSLDSVLSERSMKKILWKDIVTLALEEYKFGHNAKWQPLASRLLGEILHQFLCGRRQQNKAIISCIGFNYLAWPESNIMVIVRHNTRVPCR